MSRDNESEERLLIEAAQKDPGRFAELYENNFHRVYAYIARRVHDRSEAQDLTSHVFHQALAKYFAAAPDPNTLAILASQSAQQ